MKEESEETSKPSLLRRTLDFIKNTLYFWYIQYELITCIYIFEPWEKLFLSQCNLPLCTLPSTTNLTALFQKPSINTFFHDYSSILTICVLVCYSSYVYLPSYMYSLVNEGKRMLNI